MVSVDTRMSVSISVVAHLQFYYAFHKAELACSRIQYSEIDRERNCNSDATPNARTVCMSAIHKIVDGTPREDHLPRSLISCQVSSSVENPLSPYSVTAVRFYNVNLIVPPSSFKKLASKSETLCRESLTCKCRCAAFLDPSLFDVLVDLK